MIKRLEISRDIAAPPELVYAAISDVTRMGEWSEECHRCEWHEGCDGPVVGATFDGHNRHGEYEWITQGKVIEADPGRAISLLRLACDVGVARVTRGGADVQVCEHRTAHGVHGVCERVQPVEDLQPARKSGHREQRTREEVHGHDGHLHQRHE